MGGGADIDKGKAEGLVQMDHQVGPELWEGYKRKFPELAKEKKERLEVWWCG